LEFSGVFMKAETVKQAAKGQWLRVLTGLAPELAEAAQRIGRHVPCPVHGGKDGFRLFKDVDQSGGGVCASCGAKSDGLALLMWVNGWSFTETLTEVAKELTLPGTFKRQPKAIDKPVGSEQADERKRHLFKKIVADSVSLRHPDAEPVRLYLASRGLDEGLPNWDNLRFHPKMACRDENDAVLGYFPAMLALVEDDVGLVTIHRTYLTPEGHKAPVPDVKKIMPPLAGRKLSASAVRLGQPGRVLCVTEGIETGLAVREATGMVVWPLLSAAYMPNFQIPKGVEKLLIWCDYDQSQAGRLAAEKLAARATKAAIAVQIIEPSADNRHKSRDWLDVFNQQGVNAFKWRDAIRLT
jgi:putative DNA primase/helicase